MKKPLLTLVSALAFGTSIMAQSPTVLANFDFNSSSSLPQNAGTTATNITASINGTESDAAFGGTATGSNAFVQNTTAGNAMSMNGNTNTNTWTLTMGGSNLYKYASFKMYFQAQRSSTGATTITLSYSTDGSTYTNVSTTASPGNGSFTEATIDMSSITAINNPSALYIKFSGSGSTNTGGTLRIDNLEIEGTQSSSETNGTDTYFNGKVGIMTNTPSYTLDVNGTARVSGALTSGATTVSSLSSSGNISSSGNLSVAGTTSLTGAVTTSSLTSGATSVSSLNSSGNLTSNGNLTVAGSTTLTGAVTTSTLNSTQYLINGSPIGALNSYWNGSSGNSYTNGFVGIGNSNPQMPLDVTGNARVSGNLYVGGGFIESSNVSVINKLNADSINALSGVVNFADTVKMHKPLKALSNLDAKSISSGGTPIFSFTGGSANTASASAAPNQLNLLTNTSVNGNLAIPSLCCFYRWLSAFVC